MKLGTRVATTVLIRFSSQTWEVYSNCIQNWAPLPPPPPPLPPTPCHHLLMRAAFLELFPLSAATLGILPLLPAPATVPHSPHQSPPLPSFSSPTPPSSSSPLRLQPRLPPPPPSRDKAVMALFVLLTAPQPWQPRPQINISFLCLPFIVSSLQLAQVTVI